MSSDRCLAATKAGAQCKLRVKGPHFCGVHRDYLVTATARTPDYYLGWYSEFNNNKRAETKRLVDARLVNLGDIVSTMPAAAGYGEFYDWYCGLASAIPSSNYKLFQQSVSDAVTLYKTTYGSRAAISMTSSLHGILSIPTLSDTSKTLLLFITIHCLAIHNCSPSIASTCLLELLETGIFDTLVLMDNSHWEPAVAIVHASLEKWLANKWAITPDYMFTRREHLDILVKGVFPLTIKERRDQIKRNAKTRLAPYHEELVAATWHPDRMMDWCIDIDEVAEFAEFN